MSRYLYTYILPEIAQRIPQHIKKQIFIKALTSAKLEAPIVSGNLRKSINVINFDSKVLVLYIDNKYYSEFKYYIKVNEEPNKTGSNGYWERCIEKFRNTVFENMKLYYVSSKTKITPPPPKKNQYKTNETTSNIFEALLLSALAYGYKTDIKKILRKIKNDYYSFKRLS